MRALAQHINRTDRISGLLTSRRGQAFIRYIHTEAINQKIVHRLHIKDVWSEAIRRAQEVGGLPSGYFAPISEYPWEPLPALPDLDLVRYAIDTEQDVQVDKDEELEIATSNGVEGTFGAGSSNGDFIRHLHDFNIDGNASQGHRSIGSSDDDIIPNHEFGVDGVGPSMDSREDRIGYHDVDSKDGDNVRKLRKGGDIDALGTGEQGGYWRRQLQSSQVKPPRR
ncbi:hypothetical protein MPER_03232 [Moniliophthora perniciosa FA553]|nr:hypothetical protein MPER_03232 [Moniliophthora perniciosa FA553]